MSRVRGADVIAHESAAHPLGPCLLKRTEEDPGAIAVPAGGCAVWLWQECVQVVSKSAPAVPFIGRRVCS